MRAQRVRVPFFTGRGAVLGQMADPASRAARKKFFAMSARSSSTDARRPWECGAVVRVSSLAILRLPLIAETR